MVEDCKLQPVNPPNQPLKSGSPWRIPPAGVGGMFNSSLEIGCRNGPNPTVGRDCVKTVSRSSSRRDAVKIAQDFSPGMASGLNDLVPEARLSSCSTANLLASRARFHTGSGGRWIVQIEPET